MGVCLRHPAVYGKWVGEIGALPNLVWKSVFFLNWSGLGVNSEHPEPLESYPPQPQFWPEIFSPQRTTKSLTWWWHGWRRNILGSRRNRWLGFHWLQKRPFFTWKSETKKEKHVGRQTFLKLSSWHSVELNGRPSSERRGRTSTSKEVVTRRISSDWRSWAQNRRSSARISTRRPS